MRVSFWHRLLLLAPAGVLLAGAGAPAAPEPILTGYTGAFLGNDGYQRFLPLLRDHGFNAADFKFHPAEFDPKDPAVEAYLADLVRRCQAHGLRVFLYLYPEEKGTRNPQAAASGPYVGDDGVTHQRMYCLFQADAWQAMFRRVFFLARLSRTQAIEGVKIDIELNENSSPCFCDDCWHSFAGAGEKRDLPAAGRAPWLRESGKSDAYLAHLEARLDRAVAAYAARAHAENPRLKLGMMPARDDMLTRAFARGLGTAEAPAILDCWIPYDGLGWREEVGAFRTQMRALNPNSLVIPWFRVNRYRPEDLPAHAYAMATEADGYDMWTISMIHPEQPLKDRAAYALPPQHPDPMAYWRAFGEANRGVRAWVAAGGKTPSPFTLKPIRPLAPDVDLAGLVVPRLAPLGPRDPSAKTPAPTTYRDRTVFLVYAAERERPITARIRHQAGRQRNEPLAWALADAAGKPVSDGLVQPGETATLSQRVPEAGIYALVVQATEGGGPWYDVSFPDQAYVVGGEKPVYFFRKGSRQYFHVPAGTASFHIAFATGDRQQQARLQVWNARGESVLDETLTSDKAARKRIEVAVKAEDRGSTWSLQVGPPDALPAPYYSENYFVHLEGILSYFSDRPDGLLRIAD